MLPQSRTKRFFSVWGQQHSGINCLKRLCCLCSAVVFKNRKPLLKHEKRVLILLSVKCMDNMTSWELLWVFLLTFTDSLECVAAISWKQRETMCLSSLHLKLNVQFFWIPFQPSLFVLVIWITIRQEKNYFCTLAKVCQIGIGEKNTM